MFIRTLLLTAALSLASSAQAQTLFTVADWYQNRLNTAIATQSYYASPYYAYGYYPYPAGYEIRRMRWEIEDYRFERRWDRWNRSWR